MSCRPKLLKQTFFINLTTSFAVKEQPSRLATQQLVDCAKTTSCLRRRLERDIHLKAKHVKVIESCLSNYYAQRVPQSENIENEGAVW